MRLARTFYPLSALLILSLWLTGCGGGGSDCVGGEITGLITATELWSALSSANKPTIIDVRIDSEYALKHIPGSTNDCGCPTAAARQASQPDIVVVSATVEQAIVMGAKVLKPGQKATALDGGMDDWPYGLDISANQLTLWLGAGRTLDLIDVRTPEEWQAGNLAGSVNHPLADLAVWAPALDPAHEIVLMCASGFRSAVTRDELVRRGFSHVHNLLGGWTAVRQSGIGAD